MIAGPAVAVVLAMATLLAGCSESGVTINQQAISSALVVPGGREIVVPVTEGGCVYRSQLTETGTASQVTVVLKQYSRGTVCAAVLAFGTATATLRRPLGHRTLVDGTRDRKISYFDGSVLPRVTYLPPGYRFWRYFPASRTGWQRDYRSTQRGHAPITVAQASGTGAVGPPWSPGPPVRAGGRLLKVHQDTLGTRAFGEGVFWRAGGYSFAVYSQVAYKGQRPATVAELARSAAGLRSGPARSAQVRPLIVETNRQVSRRGDRAEAR